MFFFMFSKNWLKIGSKHNRVQHNRTLDFNLVQVRHNEPDPKAVNIQYP